MYVSLSTMYTYSYSAHNKLDGPMPPTPAEVNSDHLTQEDVDLYLKPLYARKWRVRLYTQDAYAFQ